MRVRLDPMRFGSWYRRVSRYPMRRPFSRRSLALLAVLAALLLAAVLSDLPGIESPGDARTTETPEAPVPAAANPIPAGVTGEDASTQGVGRSGAGDPTAQSEAPSTGASGEPERDCPPRIPDDLRISDTSPAAAGIELSQAMYDCAHEVGLAFATDPDAISTLLSRGIRGPLLLVGSPFDVRLANEVRRLAPERIVAAGFDEGSLPRTLAGFAFEPVPVDQQATFAPEGGPYDRVWIVDDAEVAAPLAALGHQIDVGVVAVAGDLRAAPPEARETISAVSEVEILSDSGEDAAWQLDVIRRGYEIPGGGLLMFGSEPARRLVAMYGHPVSVGLGVLGEQGPDEGVDLLGSIVAGYDADGFSVLPTFEIIATVASAGPGPDGDYSRLTSPDVIRPWVQIAAANGLYVVLDLQPGRTDFLTQAKIYEEFLRLPHVGLALDPEWRLKPDQVHMVQVGTVDAAEVNQVSEWLAALVREEALPQKLLIVHQFHVSMITNRHRIETPPELAVLIHMDGHGSPRTKQHTWDLLTSPPDADGFYWGWKNFYDEDAPMATPEQVLDLTPTPLFVSFQ
ncbi:MAG: hypothetical protein F4004_01165 [Acidimicrobiia bacterium]|nr:hypothetical protein [Acidimicrobiia bacterium]MYC45083.1 hypothetical protein [Acidimicrobiia bacterium]